jgi:hypothetical protein
MGASARQKNLIESAYRVGEQWGVAVWGEDEAGLYQIKPYPGQHHWQPLREPERYDHEYIRNGIAKRLALFHPAMDKVRVTGVLSSANAVLHPWLKEELRAILAVLPAAPLLTAELNPQMRARWQAGLTNFLPVPLPPLRLLLIWDTHLGDGPVAAGTWHFAPVHTLGGAWLNMTESMQRILVRRALEGQHPHSPEEIITLLEGVARGWNRIPTPFERGGKRAAHRQRSRERCHALGGSGACTRRSLRRHSTLVDKWRSSYQTTH